VTVETAGILFDMDGVLVNSIGSAVRCWRQWAKHYGVEGWETYVIPHGVRAVEIIKKLKPDLDVAEGLRYIEDLEIADVADLEVLPGAGALLESLPAERWAIVTSATYRLLVARLHAAKLPKPERIISGDRVEKGKPDAEPYRKGAELLGFAPADCIVVEDSPSGVGAGVAAGCRVLGVLGTTPEEKLRAAGVTWVVRSLEDVTATVGPRGLTVRLNTI
jgi:mannitol-1-/sugar-/sorbitol-6-phosphatase